VPDGVERWTAREWTSDIVNADHVLMGWLINQDLRDYCLWAAQNIKRVTAERDAAMVKVAELRIGVALVEVDLLSGSISTKQRVALAADRVRALLGGTK
jgi:hypothetical protein